MARRSYQPVDRYQFYREQEAERTEQLRIESSARWIASKLSGQQFQSLPELQSAVISLVTTIIGGTPDDDMLSTIKRACVLLWLGQCEFDLRYRRCVVKTETGVTFEAA